MAVDELDQHIHGVPVCWFSSCQWKTDISQPILSVHILRCLQLAQQRFGKPGIHRNRFRLA
jgi:hypothetical protein